MANGNASGSQHISINIGGPQFASLLFDQLNCTTDQEGFFIGEVRNHIKDTISDTQIAAEKEETIIYVYSAIPCSTVYSFYNSVGKVCTDSLQNILGDNVKKVVGWYRFRPETSLQVLLRERAIHQNLMKLFSHGHEGIFLFGAFTQSNSNGATFSFDHVCYRCENKSFVPVPLNVVNLGDTAHSDYKIQTQLVNPPSGKYRDIIGGGGRGSKIGSNVEQSTKIITDIQESIYSNLQVVCNELDASERKIRELEHETSHLLSIVGEKEAVPDGKMECGDSEPILKCQNIVIKAERKAGNKSTPPKDAIRTLPVKMENTRQGGPPEETDSSQGSVVY